MRAAEIANVVYPVPMQTIFYCTAAPSQTWQAALELGYNQLGLLIF